MRRWSWNLLKQCDALRVWPRLSRLKMDACIQSKSGSCICLVSVSFMTAGEREREGGRGGLSCIPIWIQSLSLWLSPEQQQGDQLSRCVENCTMMRACHLHTHAHTQAGKWTVYILMHIEVIQSKYSPQKPKLILTGVSLLPCITCSPTNTSVSCEVSHFILWLGVSTEREIFLPSHLFIFGFIEILLSVIKSSRGDNYLPEH